MRTWAFLSLALLGGGPVSAEPDAPQTELQTYLGTPAYQTALDDLFARLPPSVYRRCDTLITQPAFISIAEPVTFAPDGNPIGGVWRHSVQISGCGNDTTINFYFRGKPDETIDSVIAVPGQTHADLKLQNDILAQLTTAIGSVQTGCIDINVLTSSYDVPARNGVGPWNETWTVLACRRRLRATITFTPGKSGTAFRIDIQRPITKQAGRQTPIQQG